MQWQVQSRVVVAACAGDSLVEVVGPDGSLVDRLLPASRGPAPRGAPPVGFGIRNLLGTSSSMSSPSVPAPALLAPLAAGPASGPAGAGTGRRRAGSLPRAWAPEGADAPAVARARRSSGVSAMASGRGKESRGACESNAYELPLEYGQNSYSIRITTASGLDRVRLLSARVRERMRSACPGFSCRIET